MHIKEFSVTRNYKIIVRSNNDGWAIWYLEMELNGVEEDLPYDFEHVFGDLDQGADEAPEIFEQAEKDALAEAVRLETYLREKQR